MKTIVLLCLCAAVVFAAPSPAESEDLSLRTLPALIHEEVHDDLGQYELRYVTAEGTVVSERGRLVPTPDGTDKVLVYEGEYSYIGDDGKKYVTKYTSDIEGFRVHGEHLPKAPELLSDV